MSTRVANIRTHCVICGKDLLRKNRTLQPTCQDCYQFRHQVRNKATLSQSQQREVPVNEFEAIALRVYHEKGFSVLFMPTLAVFDFAVNGKRVDVKGSNASTKDGQPRFFFDLAPHKVDPDHLPDRCDLFHLIGRDEAGALYHHFIPAEVANGRTQIAIPVTSDISQWMQYRDAWHLLDKRMQPVEPVSVEVAG